MMPPPPPSLQQPTLDNQYYSSRFSNHVFMHSSWRAAQQQQQQQQEDDIPDLLDDHSESEMNTNYTNANNQAVVDQAPSWTDPEQLFSSPDDDSIYENDYDDDENDDDDNNSQSSSQTENATTISYFTNFPNLVYHGFPNSSLQDYPITSLSSPKDDETCNNTIIEIKKQRSKKALRASTVGAFNTFLKALFGIGMLSNPAVLGEVGLVLGTFCHLFIIVGCAFACYLLLTARQLAVNEVRERERREEEERLEYEEFVRRRRMVLEERVLERGDHGDSDNGGRRKRNGGTVYGGGRGVRGEEEDPFGTPLRRTPPQIMGTPDGWGRIQNSMVQAGEVLSPACEPCAAGGGADSDFPPPLIDDETPEVTLNPSPPKFSDSLDGGFGESREEKKVGGNDTITTNSTIVPPPPLHRKTTPKRSRSQPKLTPTSSSSAYHRFEDNPPPKNRSSGSLTHALSNNAPPPPPLPPPPKKSRQVRLLTYGDVAKYLAGPTFAQLMIFTIVSVHLMFASGMLHIAVENLCYIAGWDRLGFSYTDVMYTGDDYYPNYYGSMRRHLESGSNDHNDSGSRSNDNSHSGSHSRDNRAWQSINIEEAEEEYAKWEGPDFIGRLAMASLLFPIIHGLLQIPSLKELATISTMGLVTYALGCVGSMMYSAVVLSDFQPFVDRPDDILQLKWSGIPTYVATTIYAIEGINLALPTVNTLEGSDRAGNLLKKKGGKENDKTNSSIKMVVTAVFCYGCVTLFVSWMGLAGGLGGGIGTIHEQEGCRDVTYCLNSVKVQYVYMLSLGVALVLTLPVILYPSTEMLEIWLDERADEKRRKLEAEAEANNVPNYEDMTTKQLKYIRRGILEAEASANNVPNPEKMTTKQLKAVRRHIRSKSLMDDEAISKLDVSTKTKDATMDAPPPPEEGVYVEMTTITNSNGDQNTYNPPSCSPTCHGPSVPIKDINVNPNPLPTKDTAAADERKIRAKRKLKYWKLRMFLAFLICFIGTLEGSFPQITRAAEVIRGVGLSMAGLISPPLLYMSAVGGRFSAGMASAMALLIGLGLFNIVLVLMSAFGGKDYIIEEGPGHYHDSFYELDE